jgi:D-glucosaminate-6-phosphate ammonia-lyase
MPAGHNSLTVMPYMMMPGDDKVGAPRVHALLSNPPRRAKTAPSGGPAAVGGEWDVEIVYNRDHAVHTLFFEQAGGKLQGNHRGEFLPGDVRCSVEGAKLRCRSSHRYEGTYIGYTFEGTVDGDTIRGTVDVGEYGKAPFTARRHFRA